MVDTGQNANQPGRRVLTNAIVVVFSVYVGFLLYQSVYYNFQLNNKVEKLEAQIAKQEAEKLGFEALITYYQTNTFQQLEARRKLGMRFPGEKIVIVELAQKQTDLGGEKTTDSQGNSSVSNLKLWFKFFSGKLKRV
jgi:cell division protein FtsB